MDSKTSKNLQIIQDANKEMLNYVNKSFLQDLENIQSIKTQSFEIDVKIEELEKTKDLYAFKASSRKSVFTPTVADDFENERNKIIDAQISDLKDLKSTLGKKIKSLESSLKVLKKRLATLNEANAAINSIVANYPDDEAETGASSDGFEFVESSTDEQQISHGYNILMQQAFDNTYISTMLDNLHSSLNRSFDSAEKFRIENDKTYQMNRRCYSPGYRI